MSYCMKKLILYIVYFFSFVPIYAIEQDSLQWSLLTCQPGQEIYQLFGHTALRCQNFTKKMDVVFNYGMFSFNAPNFVIRFVEGKTDYELGVEKFCDFVSQYKFRGTGIYYQTLNLTQSESARLWNGLIENYKPENRTYRYNYFYNNCTTRARDMFEACIDGNVVYQKREEVKSFRSIIHEFTKDSKWDEFGIDLLLGQDADKPIDMRLQMFAPFYLLSYMRDAQIVTSVATRNLVLSEGYLEPFTNKSLPSGFVFSPLICTIILLIITIIIVAIEWKRKKIIWIWDLFFFSLQGIAGGIIFFLMFFSSHPTVNSNWLFVLLNPIPLMYLPWMMYKDIKKKKDRYHYINIVYLIIFMILMSFVPQTFNASVILLACSLLVTSIGHLIVYRIYK